MRRREAQRTSLGRRAAPAWALLLAAVVACAGPETAAPARSPIVVRLGAVRHQMAAGLGFSWHAISREVQFEGLLGLDNRNARGSAWGGNPPLDFEEAWRQLAAHASWLGPDWVRVELSQRMYEPERGVFDWDNEEMRALYRILDWCQESGAAVLLAQMWSFVEWNAHPGVPALQSAPRSIDEFAAGLATLVEQLVVERGYDTIRWLAIVNEPNARWFLGPGGERQPIAPALAAVRRELDRRGLAVGLAAPGWSDLRDEPLDPASDRALAAYDAHSWGRPDPWGMRRWAGRARARGVPFLLSEIGDMRFGWKNDDAGPASWPANLSNAEKVVVGLAEGVDGFSRWSFTNRGDLDGQFQLVRTWDRARREYLRQVEPEPVPYFLWGILTRLTAAGSAVLETEAPEEGAVRAAALAGPGGELTVFLVNPDETPRPTALRVEGAAPGLALYRYEVTEAAVRRPDFSLAPDPESLPASAVDGLDLVLPAASVTALSTLALPATAPGLVADRPAAPPS